MSDPLTGTHEEIAQGLAAYIAAGHEEVICWVTPAGRAGLQEFARVHDYLDSTPAA